ncbi:histamine H2 receptor-like [Montipora foliosa]|uniref:histamine H2 receptor-like n=1 Tax=Montipora foliosa TaxID=591990 RepID=UPI0035F12068
MNRTSRLNGTCYYLDRFQVFHATPLTTQYIVNVSLNAFLAVVATLGNAVILYALRKSAALRPPSRALLYSLAASDLFVGLLVQPFYVVYKTSQLMNNHELYCVTGIGFHLSANVFSAVSFLSITAIAIDRLLAVHLGTTYQTKVSLRRVITVILTIWALTSLWVFTWIIDIAVYELFNITAVNVCLFVCSCSYLWLWFKLRRLRKALERYNPEENFPATSSRTFGVHKRSVTNMFYVYFLLLICYVPYLTMFYIIHTTQRNATKFAVLSYTITLVFANSALNPFLYCWRIKEIRKEVIATFSKLFFCS